MLLMHEDEDNIKEILASQITTPSLTYLAFHHNNIRCARWLLSVGVQLVDGGFSFIKAIPSILKESLIDLETHKG